MKIVYPHCAGIDIHKETMTVCIFADGETGTTPQLQPRTFPTHRAGIRELEAWLTAHHVTEVGLESTGVYWKPVWNALEGKVGLHLCNPHHIRALPGSKTDLRDGRRIAELLAHGLLPTSFIPPRWQRELRDLTRLRVSLTQERTRLGNRIEKVLEDAQIKLGCVASAVLGVSGRLMLEALVKGENDPAVLSELARGRLKKKKEQLQQALEGDVREHHRFQVEELLRLLKHCEEEIERLDHRIASYLEPYRDIVARLDQIPGVDEIAAAGILAEIGPQVEAWEDARHLASWACLCPGNNLSAGKRLTGRTRKGNRWLRRLFCQMAWAAARKKGSYLKAQFRRLSSRRGAKRAALAVAHTLVTIIYHLLQHPELEFRDLGEDFFDQRDAAATASRLVRRLEKLGYDVNIKTRAA